MDYDCTARMVITAALDPDDQELVDAVAALDSVNGIYLLPTDGAAIISRLRDAILN